MKTVSSGMLPVRSGRNWRAGLVGAAVIVLVSPVQADCMDDAGTSLGVSPALLRAVAMHESAMRSDAVNRNANGSVDFGLMQINSGWLPLLQQHGIAAQNLLDPCVNAYIGAWILRANVARFGATWKAVGAYNASSPARQLRYANAVYGVFVRQSALAYPRR